MTKKKCKLLILGGGFGGIKVALELFKDDRFDITLVSDQENFRYYPTLFRAATGGSLSAASIPLDEIFADKPVKLVHGVAKKLDRQSKSVILAKDKKIGFDKLIIALGVTTNFFGIKGLKEYSYGIKSAGEATELRDHIHKQLLDKGQPDLNYVVIGGGPTGVELAGALPEYIHLVMRKHSIKDRKLHIDLVEAAPRLVPRMPKPYSVAIQKRLRKLGVKLFLGEAVQAETADSLVISTHPIKSHTVVWTAGVTNHSFFSKNGFRLNQHGKVLVDEHLMAESYIYVVGDNADTPYSGLAQTALYDAGFVSSNLIREANGKNQLKYRPKKPIYVTPVGKGWAAVLWGRTQIYGRLGWFLRSAADFAGYHDYEPWWPAGKHWMAEFQTAENCQICAGK